MYVILTYDVAVRRNAKVLKICRKYLTHVQKSVFEGDIAANKLHSLQLSLERVINPDEDQITIYEFETLRYSAKSIIGYQFTTDNIL